MNKKLHTLHEQYGKHCAVTLYASTKMDTKYADAGNPPPRIGQCSCGLWYWHQGDHKALLYGTLAGWIMAEHPAIIPKLRTWYTRVAKRYGVWQIEPWHRVKEAAERCRKTP